LVGVRGPNSQGTRMTLTMSERGLGLPTPYKRALKTSQPPEEVS
jgi:hypothetical protein